jgi:hypothetical protein
MRVATGGLGVLLVLAALGTGTRVPYTLPEAEAATLRLSWRLRGERVQECRRPGPEELARVPVHMRREEVCEGRIAPYRLRLALDGVLLEDALVTAGGARADRPLYVHRELRLAPGDYAIAVTFELESAAAPQAGPMSLQWSGMAGMLPGDVLLITHDAETGTLVARRR